MSACSNYAAGIFLSDNTGFRATGSPIVFGFIR